MDDPIAEVQWWDGSIAVVACPYNCGDTHGYLLTLDDKGSIIEYKHTKRRIAPCTNDDYILEFPAAYEIDKPEAQYQKAGLHRHRIAKDEYARGTAKDFEICFQEECAAVRNISRLLRAAGRVADVGKVIKECYVQSKAESKVIEEGFFGSNRLTSGAQYQHTQQSADQRLGMAEQSREVIFRLRRKALDLEKQILARAEKVKKVVQPEKSQPRRSQSEDINKLAARFGKAVVSDAELPSENTYVTPEILVELEKAKLAKPRKRYDSAPEKTAGVLNRSEGFSLYATISGMYGLYTHRRYDGGLVYEALEIAAKVGFKFPVSSVDTKNQDQGKDWVDGTYNACHTEAKLATYFVNQHVFHPEDHKPDSALYALWRAMPSAKQRSALIVIDHPNGVCTSCRNFIKAVNKKYDLNLVATSTSDKPPTARFRSPIPSEGMARHEAWLKGKLARGLIGKDHVADTADTADPVTIEASRVPLTPPQSPPSAKKQPAADEEVGDLVSGMGNISVS